MIRSFQTSGRTAGLTLALAGALLATAPGARVEESDVVAIQAGTIHAVEQGVVHRGGATVLVRDGKIAAIGKDVEVPAGARVVDYGASATIVPGLVAADSSYVPSQSAPRTASPTLRAVDHFDPWSTYYSSLSGGVTSAYLAPARNRLIAGQGAVVKLHGDPTGERVLNAAAAIHGAIGSEARNAPGYWEPPLPATVDVGLGVAQRQLPRTTMGAVVAIEELMAFAGEDGSLATEYGLSTGPALAELMAAGVPWRFGADSPGQIRALLSAFAGSGSSLVVHGSGFAGEVADELKTAGAWVIYHPPADGFRNLGKGPDAPSPNHEGASQLAEAGVPLSIVTPRGWSTGKLMLAANFARRGGGLTAEQALEAITLTPARMMGVADQVGSLAVGKHADLCVLAGAPFEEGTAVRATWVEGEIAWKAKDDAPVVISVEELHLGDGHVLSPGEVLVAGGKVREVGRRVGRPAGTVVVTGAAAMPGAIDAMGRLGLAGSRKGFSTRTDLTRIVEPADATDRRVARAGVTTVNLSSASAGAGQKTMAYKPAGDDVGQMIIDPTSAMILQWSNPIPTQVGQAVKGQLAQAAAYVRKWEEYEKAMASWNPPAPEEEDGDEDEEDAEGEDDEKEEKKKKKPKKKPEAIAVTGTWEASVGADEETGEGGTHVRMRLLEHADGSIEGSARVSTLEDLVELEGSRDGYDVSAEGLTEDGTVRLRLTLEFVDNFVDQPQLVGKAHAEDGVFELTFDRTSTDYPVVRRPESRKPAPAPKAPKGQPRSPGINDALEPIRRAMKGECALICIVNSEGEIAACADAFGAHGIRPVILYTGGGSFAGAHAWADKVAGVLLRGNATLTRSGIPTGNRYANLAMHGVPIAFQSEAEEGAAGLIDVVTTHVAEGLSSQAAVAGLTSGAARMLAIDDRVGTLAPGMDGDVVLLDGPPLQPATRVLRVWVEGEEVLP